MYAAEFVWPSKAKPSTCPSLTPAQKNRQDEVEFTFNVSKYDHIFNESFKNGNIRLSHAIPPLEELKQYAYCKWHNSTSHAIDNYNVFRRQVQSDINLIFLFLTFFPIPPSLLELLLWLRWLRAARAVGHRNQGSVAGCIWHRERAGLVGAAAGHPSVGDGGAPGQGRRRT